MAVGTALGVDPEDSTVPGEERRKTAGVVAGSRTGPAAVLVGSIGLPTLFLWPSPKDLLS